ncbi:hypothetical protein HDU98_006778 [Podochytrium sp. JEL0797]|nr:hypothetical protein HDU98_006778 [Podochytrium sp. JEL0797]
MLSYARDHDVIHKFGVWRFLEPVVKSKTLFLNVYQVLEEEGMMVEEEEEGAEVERDESGVVWSAERYVSVYKEIWGDKIEMEVIDHN